MRSGLINKRYILNLKKRNIYKYSIYINNKIQFNINIFISIILANYFNEFYIHISFSLFFWRVLAHIYLYLYQQQQKIGQI